MMGSYSQQQQWQMMQMQQREQQRMAAQQYRMQMQRQASTPAHGYYGSQQQIPSHSRQQSDMSGLSSAFSNVNFGTAPAPASTQSADPFASNGTSGGVDPFSVGFNEYTTAPKAKKKSEGKTKEKDVFDSLGEFAGF